MICADEVEPARDGGALKCVMMDSCGPAPDLFLSRRDIEPSRLESRR